MSESAVSETMKSVELSEDYLWQLGRVATVTETHTTIEFDSTEQCARCLSGQGCGAGVFAKLFARKGAVLSLSGVGGFHPGQMVQVGVLPGAILRASMAVYAWPLGLFLAVLVGGHYGLSIGQTAFGELGLLAVALACAGIGIWAIGHLRSRMMNPIVVPWSCMHRQ